MVNWGSRPPRDEVQVAVNGLNGDLFPGDFCLPCARMVRLKEIAAAAGVSVMTVSKALRDKPDLSAATKLRIQGWRLRWDMFRTSVRRACATRRAGCLGSSFRRRPIPSMPASCSAWRNGRTNWVRPHRVPDAQPSGTREAVLRRLIAPQGGRDLSLAGVSPGAVGPDL